MNKLNHRLIYSKLAFPEVFIMLLLLAGASALFAAGSTSAPPTTRRDDVVDDYFGTKVADPYQWLEDQNSPDTRAWIEAQDDYSRPILDGLPGRDVLRQRLTALMNVDVIGTPSEHGGRYFFERRKAGQDLFVLYMRQGLDGPDHVLLDPHPLSPDHSTSVGLMDFSKDGKLMAYFVRRGGKDEVSIHLMQTDSRHELADVLPEGNYFSVSIKPDKSGFYYARRIQAGPRIFYHALGSDPASDKQIFGDNLGLGDIAFSRLSDDGRYLLIDVLHGSASEKTELYLQDLAAQTPVRPVVNDITARFSGDLAGDRLYIQTNWNAPNGRIFLTDLATPTRDHWREVVPQSEAVIEGISAAGGKLFVNYVHNAHAELKVFEAGGGEGREIPLPALGSASGVSGRWESPNVFYEFSSFAQAPTIYRYDVEQAKPEVWAREEVPLKSDDFEVHQVWYASKDGTRVPMFIADRKGTRRDGSNPTLITGYGGFDVSLLPSFSAEAAAWVEGGGVFAVPNLRGGGEFGEKWHKAGMLQNKQNVFDDFLAAAQYLIDNHYTNPSKLGITGQSNGGLLVGAALTQRPDLFRAVVCRYPLLDMLRYENFLVARYWVPEYGAAVADAEQFKVLYAYSPYQNVKQGADYPAVLFVTGDGDTRVAPLHARKMAAMLQWAASSENRSDRPILLSYDTKSGHSGGRPLSKQIDELVDELSFFSWQLGAGAK
ncbi:MAG TPA: prolyl oligopeptidase family serine peptidase [Terriglobia bacterium]|nr:prolyl oligopeptidase family serine peptidase [Terriglobia bacterium]